MSIFGDMRYVPCPVYTVNFIVFTCQYWLSFRTSYQVVW